MTGSRSRLLVLVIIDGWGYSTDSFGNAIGSARPPKALHLLGLVSPGGVHSSSEHLYALLRMAKRAGITRVFVHAFTDGRDEPPTSAAGFVEQLQGQIREIGVGKIASIS